METCPFDLTAPLLTWADGALAPAYPDGLRLVLWGALAAASSMGLYWLLSPQARLQQVRQQVAEARRARAAFLQCNFAPALSVRANRLPPGTPQMERAGGSGSHLIWAKRNTPQRDRII